MTKRVLTWLLAVVWLLVCLGLAGAAAYGIACLSTGIGIVKQTTDPKIVRGIYSASSAIAFLLLSWGSLMRAKKLKGKQ